MEAAAASQCAGMGALEPECVICLDCCADEEFVLLDCGHRFHAGCVCNWLQRNCVCPTCRQPPKSMEARFAAAATTTPQRNTAYSARNLPEGFASIDVIECVSWLVRSLRRAVDKRHRAAAQQAPG